MNQKDYNNNPIKAIVIGCGQRGFYVYGEYAKKFPNKLRFIACVDSDKNKAIKFAKIHNIPENFVFNSDEDVFQKSKFADAVFICTPDPYHEKEAIMALENGYHVFLEKPMAITKLGCENILKKSEKSNSILMVGFVLRYAPIFAKIKQIINSGLIGDVINIKHSENMGFWVYAHSFVRGLSYTQSPIILQKGCHDFDLIFWFADSFPKYINSFYMPSVFNIKKAPINAPDRCIDGCSYSKNCLFDAVQFYMQGKFMLLDSSKSESWIIRKIFNFALKHPKIARNLISPLKKMNLVPWRQWPVNQITDDLSNEGILKALQDSPYGRCIYKFSNPQPSSQVTAIKFENGITATYTLHGFSYRDGREIRIDGIKGTIKGYFYNTGYYIDLFEHQNNKSKRFKFKLEKVAGGGGDFKIVDEFINCIKTNSKPSTSARESLVSHLISFAANESAASNKTIEINKFEF